MSKELSLLFFIVFISCSISPTGDVTKLKNGCSVIVIDSCEYIQFNSGIAETRVYTLTHKGNCKNRIHVYNNY